MRKAESLLGRVVVAVVAVTLLCSAGCATKGQTGALTGAGAGALIGGLANMHGSWGATALIGAGVGAGLGYLIGNEEDKKDAAKRQAAMEGELKPLAGTIWQVININPKPKKEYQSIVAHFRPDGSVVTTKTDMNGQVVTTTEKYRVVRSTLIINKPDYVENTQFKIDGNKLIIDYGNGSAVLQRIS
jgi:hypothetical protein